MAKPRKPPQLSEFESYVLARIDSIDRRFWGLMGALGVVAALVVGNVHVSIDPTIHIPVPVGW